jgi:hypothetical protein
VLEGSSLLAAEYEAARVFVEWNFLDFNREICETPGTFPLPRRASDVCNVDAERGSTGSSNEWNFYSINNLVYELNRRRLELLSQWTTSNNRFVTVNFFSNQSPT